MQLLAKVLGRVLDVLDRILYTLFDVFPYFPNRVLCLVLRAGKGVGPYGQRNLLALIFLFIGHGAIPSHAMTSGFS